jgi:hypothetical protein
MSDAVIATIGRRLAAALTKFARERDADNQKKIWQAQTDLCAAYRDELTEQPSPPTEGS